MDDDWRYPPFQETGFHDFVEHGLNMVEIAPRDVNMGNLELKLRELTLGIPWESPLDDSP